MGIMEILGIIVLLFILFLYLALFCLPAFFLTKESVDGQFTGWDMEGLFVCLIGLPGTLLGLIVGVSNNDRSENVSTNRNAFDEVDDESKEKEEPIRDIVIDDRAVERLADCIFVRFNGKPPKEIKVNTVTIKVMWEGKSQKFVLRNWGLPELKIEVTIINGGGTYRYGDSSLNRMARALYIRGKARGYEYELHPNTTMERKYYHNGEEYDVISTNEISLVFETYTIALR